jgi:hypothetical protein
VSESKRTVLFLLLHYVDTKGFSKGLSYNVEKKMTTLTTADSDSHSSPKDSTGQATNPIEKRGVAYR